MKYLKVIAIIALLTITNGRAFGLPISVPAHINTFPLGTVSNVTSTTCSGSPSTNAVCYTATVNCPQTDTITVTLAVSQQTGTPLGLIEMQSGAPGSGFLGGNSTGAPMADQYFLDGFNTVQTSWSTSPVSTYIIASAGQYPPNDEFAACRMATVDKYVHDHYAGSSGNTSTAAGAFVGMQWKGLPFGLQGHSQGSGMQLYTLKDYGASDWVKALMVSASSPPGGMQQSCLTLLDPNYNVGTQAMQTSVANPCTGTNTSTKLGGSTGGYVDTWHTNSFQTSNSCATQPGNAINQAQWADSVSDPRVGMVNYLNGAQTRMSSFWCTGDNNGAAGGGHWMWDTGSQNVSGGPYFPQQNQIYNACEPTVGGGNYCISTSGENYFQGDSCTNTAASPISATNCPGFNEMVTQLETDLLNPSGIINFYVTSSINESNPGSFNFNTQQAPNMTYETTWNFIQPTDSGSVDSSYTWTGIENALASLKYNGQMSLAIYTGKWSPPWLWKTDGVAGLTAPSVPNPPPVSACTPPCNFYPAPWDSTFQAKLATMIATVGAHVDAAGYTLGTDPRISRIHINAIMGDTGEVALDSGLEPSGEFTLANWQSVGYSQTNIRTAFDNTLHEVQAAFPHPLPEQYWYASDAKPFAFDSAHNSTTIIQQIRGDIEAYNPNMVDANASGNTNSIKIFPANIAHLVYQTSGNTGAGCPLTPAAVALAQTQGDRVISWEAFPGNGGVNCLPGF